MCHLQKICKNVIINKTVYDEPQHLIMSCMDSNGPIAEWVCRRLFRSRTYWLFCCSFAPPLIIIVIIIIIGCWCCFYTDTNVNCGWEMFWILSFLDTIQIFFMFFLWIIPVTKTFEARSNCRGVIIIIIPVIIFNCFTKEAIKQLSYSNIFMKNPEKKPVWANRSYYLRLEVNLIAQLFWSLLQWCAVLLHLLVKYTFYDYCCLHGLLCYSLKQALKKREKAWSWRVSWFYLETCWENIFTLLWKVFQIIVIVVAAVGLVSGILLRTKSINVKLGSWSSLVFKSQVLYLMDQSCTHLSCLKIKQLKSGDISISDSNVFHKIQSTYILCLQ